MTEADESGPVTQQVDPRGTPGYRFFKSVIFHPLLKRLWRPRVVGLENIPPQGAIFAANHLDAGDAVALPGIIPVPTIMPAKKELFEGKSPSGRFIAWFLRFTGQAPLDRGGGATGRTGLGSIEQFVTAGGYAGIFPEGTRSPDGRLYRGHTGVARLALRTGAPVVPVGHINTYLKRNWLGLKIAMHDAQMIIGEPLDFSDRREQIDDVQVLREVTNEVMAAIQQLTGQEYVDVYASRIKKGELTIAQADEFVIDSPLHAAASGQPVPQRHDDGEPTHE